MNEETIHWKRKFNDALLVVYEQAKHLIDLQEEYKRISRESIDLHNGLQKVKADYKAAKEKLEKQPDPEWSSPATLCMRDSIQNCHVCDERDCDDNTSPLKKALDEAQQTIKDRDAKISELLEEIGQHRNL